MTESTATKVGVPGDKRLGDLKVNKPVPWYGKLPVVRWNIWMNASALIATASRSAAPSKAVSTVVPPS